jgi:hypothetical protein
MSRRCSRSPVVTVYPARRYVVEAARTSLRWITTCSERFGSFSRNTLAVITLVMLAIERLSVEFDSQRTSPFSGL